jgi:hypothetical protein
MTALGRAVVGTVCATALAAVLCGSVLGQEEGAPLPIGSRLELFVDDYLIDTMTNATQQLHSPQAREIVLETNMPWEGPWSGYFTVFQDGDFYRMYYRGMPQGGPESTCYAESKDGINWVRPTIGLFEFRGSKDNNIIWTSDIPGEGGMSHNFAPFKDTNPAAKPDELYKAVTKGPLIAMCSADGWHWRKMRDEPIITEGAFDSLNIAFYDNLREEYVCYLRDFKDGVRHIRVSTSKDFLNWTKPEWLDFGDAPPEHLYTNAIRPYFRAPHIYMGFPKRLVPERTSEIDRTVGETAVSDGVFMTSRDQVHFHRWLEAFVRPGLDPGNWMQRTNMAAWGMLQTSPEEISLYYSEHYYQPTHRIRRRTIRTDGFVSINAKYQGGELLTKPLTFEGKELVINYATSAVGSVQVEIQDAAGHAIDGFALAQCPEIFGDEIERVVSWEGGSDVSRLAGQPVRLRFAMKDADLYSIRFRP